MNQKEYGGKRKEWKRKRRRGNERERNERRIREKVRRGEKVTEMKGG